MVTFIGFLLFILMLCLIGVYIGVIEPFVQAAAIASPTYGPDTTGNAIILGVPFLMFVAALYFLISYNPRDQYLA